MGWERALQSLFEEPGQGKPLSLRDQALREIYESIFTLWCEHPERSDRQMAAWVMERFGRSRRQVYEDVSVVKSALGNVQNAAKEWHRYRVLEMLSQAYQMARDNGDVSGMVRAASQIGHFTQLDKPEPQGIDWESLQAPTFEPSADPALLGISVGADAEAARRRLERRYGLAAGDEVTEVEAEWVDAPQGAAPAQEHPGGEGGHHA